MRIKIEKSVTDGVYKVKFITEDFSVSETELMTKFGEPEVEMGGTFTVGSDVWSISSNLKKIETDFPVEVLFDSRDNANAMAHAMNYKNIIVVRMQTEMQTLKTNYDGFTGEETVNV
jgi:hypothetical protein